MMPAASFLIFDVRLLRENGVAKTHELGAVTGGQARQSQRPGWPHLVRLVQQRRVRP